MLSKFNFKFAFIIYFSFILFTIIGTLSHEFGHYAVAKYFGYKPTIHFGSTTYGTNNLEEKVHNLYDQNKTSIDAKKDFAQKNEFEALKKEIRIQHLWMSAGGPLQTILTGTIGLILVIWLRGKRQYATRLLDWLCLFITLLWLRQPTNLFFWLFKQVRGNGDEVYLSRNLHFPEGTLIAVTGTLGLLICVYSILNFVPKNKLKPFIIAGFLGGISGYVLWLKILGPIMLP